MNNILICGSREMLPGMEDWARRAVQRAFAQGWTIGEGDAPGVDKVVAEAAIEFFHLHPDPQADAPENVHLWTLCTVFGLGVAPRHGVVGRGVGYCQLKEIVRERQYETGSESRRYVRIYHERTPIRTYEQRDRYLVEQADRVFCLWNGRSKGTWKVYEYAWSLGKDVWIKDFSKG